MQEAAGPSIQYISFGNKNIVSVIVEVMECRVLSVSVKDATLGTGWGFADNFLKMIHAALIIPDNPFLGLVLSRIFGLSGLFLSGICSVFYGHRPVHSYSTVFLAKFGLVWY